MESNINPTSMTSKDILAMIRKETDLFGRICTIRAFRVPPLFRIFYV